MPTNHPIDWQQMFVPTGSLIELVLRASLMYLLILAGFRMFRRDAGSLSVSDLLVVVLIADAAQNGMAGEYKSITGGIVLCGTVILGSQLLDWLAARFPVLRHWIEPPAVEVVRDGHALRRNLRQEMISELIRGRERRTFT